MARRRRHYRGITSVNLGGYLPVELDDNVKVMDVLAGAAVGVIGSAALKAVLNKFGGDIYAKVKGTVGPAMPLVSGLATGLVLYYAQRNMNASRAKGHYVGAVAAGAAATVLAYAPKLSEMLPAGLLDFSDVVSVNLGYLGGYNGLLVNDTSDQFNGLLVTDTSDSLNGLAAMSMGEEDDDGLTSLAAM